VRAVKLLLNHFELCKMMANGIRAGESRISWQKPTRRSMRVTVSAAFQSLMRWWSNATTH